MMAAYSPEIFLGRVDSLSNRGSLLTTLSDFCTTGEIPKLSIGNTNKKKPKKKAEKKKLERVAWSEVRQKGC